MDDAAVLPDENGFLVLTHDMLVENVHYLSEDPPEDVAWKLLAVNLSDLAAKAATPVGCLLGYTLGDDPDWNARFVTGLGEALRYFNVPLLGGDTVSSSGPRVLGLTAVGRTAFAPDRRAAKAGDDLWVAGAIGDAGRGLALLLAGETEPAALVATYRRPMPLLDIGQVLGGHIAAMADVSDGLLIDGRRMADASGLAVTINLDAAPIASPDRLAAATAGDDYALIFAAPEAKRDVIFTLLQPFGVSFARIGRFSPGTGLSVADGRGAVPLPAALGYEHGA
ncbi:thiamine-phosphate kinase [Sphingomonas sp. ID0503]|uniref:thiamine-phosphate kinase n=1 Tax=Sphingomonas sp. ID0503 TaxID=3399691 RepID=UPI003AFB68CD